MKKSFVNPLFSIALILCLSVAAMADIIKLKNGREIRGTVVGFRDQQFIVLSEPGARGRRSEFKIYMEDVESIEFESGRNTDAGTFNNTVDSPPSTSRPNNSQNNFPRPGTQSGGTSTSRPPSSTPASSTSPDFFQINTRVRADSTSNGWTNTGLVVRRGQRLRLTATGNVNLGAGRVATPSGVRTIPDREKLMRDEPTGALIAVIGDDNDDFILVGRSREFVAQRDGVLFLGVNEGNLNDNTGAFDVVIEAEAIR